MNKPRERKTVSDRQLEDSVRTIMRSKGWLVPTSATEVLAFEQSSFEETSAMPTLADPMSLLPKLTRTSVSPPEAQSYWTHPSVLLLREAGDPLDVITNKARLTVLTAMEKGWHGPPYDPFALAELLGIRTVPTQDVIDARTFGTSGGKYVTEFNPNRPPARIRYSVAHEIAHTLFPDCGAAVRNRATHEQMAADEWQLEMLCNVAAAEILMPIGTLQDAQDRPLTINYVLDLRERYQVSSEAILLRVVRLSRTQVLAFAARYDAQRKRYVLDYSFSSASWKQRLRPGHLLPRSSKASECTGIGHTAAGREELSPAFEPCDVEYLGIPPYPNQTFPRVLGIARPSQNVTAAAPTLTYVKGDATSPRGRGVRLIVQIVNDRGLTWGGGFALAVRKKWPHVQDQFTTWATSNRSQFRLGSTVFIRVSSSVVLANLIAQHGYGPSPNPRIRYGALVSCLHDVQRFALANQASLHMPRLGSGQAGGNWSIVSELLEESLCRVGLDVTVYDLPTAKAPGSEQQQLDFRGDR